MPAYALDGFDLSSVFQGVSLAIFLGLVLGKFFGIFSFTFISIKRGGSLCLMGLHGKRLQEYLL